MLLNFSLELLQEVSVHLESQADLNSLAQTNTATYKLLNPELYRRFSNSALLWAAKNDSKETALKAIDHGASINTADSFGSTPLTLATQACSGQMVRLCLETPGIQVNIPSHYSALDLVSYIEDEDIAKDIGAMLLHHPDIDAKLSCYYGPFILAVYNGCISLLQLLLQHSRAQGNKYPPLWRHALYSAMKEGNLSIFKMLLELPDLDTSLFKNGILLCTAVQMGHHHIIKFLLQHREIRVNKAYKSFTPLQYAVNWDFIAITQILLSHNSINVNQSLSKRTVPLLIAIKKGHLEIACLLLYHGAHVNIIDINGDTALHIAVSLDIIDMIRILLMSPGINVNKRNKKGYTPLMLAVKERKESIMQCLLQHHDIKINCIRIVRHPKYIKQTALFMAIVRNFTNIVHSLVRHKNINVNAGISFTKLRSYAASHHYLMTLRSLQRGNHTATQVTRRVHQRYTRARLYTKTRSNWRARLRVRFGQIELT